jgi:hypothetical protein
MCCGDHLANILHVPTRYQYQQLLAATAAANGGNPMGNNVAMAAALAGLGRGRPNLMGGAGSSPAVTNPTAGAGASANVLQGLINQAQAGGLNAQQLRNLAMRAQLANAARPMGTMGGVNPTAAALVAAAANGGVGQIRPGMLQGGAGMGPGMVNGNNPAAAAALVAAAAQGGQLTLQQMQLLQQLRNQGQAGNVNAVAAALAAANPNAMAGMAGMAGAVQAAAGVQGQMPQAGQPGMPNPGLSQTPVHGHVGMTQGGGPVPGQQPMAPPQVPPVLMNMDVPQLQKVAAQRLTRLRLIEEELKKPELDGASKAKLVFIRLQLRSHLLQIEYAVRTKTGTLTQEHTEVYRNQMAAMHQQIQAFQQQQQQYANANLSDPNAVRPPLNMGMGTPPPTASNPTGMPPSAGGAMSPNNQGPAGTTASRENGKYFLRTSKL